MDSASELTDSPYAMDELSPPAGPAPPLLIDGRQSDAAIAISRGASRCLLAHGFARLPELSLPNGRRADLCALGESGEFWIVEIKSSLADFRADQKWPEYRDYCDRLFFAIARDFPLEVLPDDCGLILADKWGGEIVRPASEHKLSAARRKVMVHRFARAAAMRLHALADPEAGLRL